MQQRFEVNICKSCKTKLKNLNYVPKLLFTNSSLNDKRIHNWNKAFVVYFNHHVGAALLFRDDAPRLSDGLTDDSISF